MGVPNQPISNTPWNRTMNMPFNPQVNNGAQRFYPGSGAYLGGSTYTRGPQSCIAMTGERITVQSLAGIQPEGMKNRLLHLYMYFSFLGNTPSMSFQSMS
jgi:hypothetical protein